MTTRLPPPLAPGHTICVVAPSRSLGALRDWSGFGDAEIAAATGRLEAMGLRVTFGEHVMETSEAGLGSVEGRLADLHAAFRDDSVHAILAATGGIGAVQILDGIDYDLAAEHPKPLIGYSDVGHVHLALLARSGIAGYYGPNFSGLAMRHGLDDTLAWFRACLFDAGEVELRPSATWSDDNWLADQENRTFRAGDGFWCIAQGAAEGTIVGGGVHCLAALQGTACFPDLAGSVLFVESPGAGKASLMELDSALRTLAMQPSFGGGTFGDGTAGGVRGLVLGRFPSSARVTRTALAALLAASPRLRGLPVIANVDFGHTTPAMTIPIGGRCRITASPDAPPRIVLCRRDVR